MSFERPIFIGGLAHSGKTPLRMALGAHPRISMTRRTYMWDRFYGRFGSLDSSENLERCLEAMLREEGIRLMEPDVDRVRREFPDGPATYGALFALFHRHHAEKVGKPRWGDQLGFIERFAAGVFDAFPDARVVHMIRDPRSRTSSLEGPRPLPTSLGWETARWLASAGLATSNLDRFDDRYLVVRFEDFAADPEGVLRRVCDFIGEIYVPGMMDPISGGGLRSNGGREEIAPPARRASPWTAAFVERYAGGPLDRFGYPTATVALSAAERLAFALAWWPLSRVGMAAWRLLDASRRFEGRMA